MVVELEDLRSDVIRRPELFCQLLSLGEFDGSSEVDDRELRVLLDAIQEAIFRFDVSVADVPLVHVRDS